MEVNRKLIKRLNLNEDDDGYVDAEKSQLLSIMCRPGQVQTSLPIQQ